MPYLEVVRLKGQVPPCDSGIVIFHRMDPRQSSMVSLKVKLSSKEVVT